MENSGISESESYVRMAPKPVRHTVQTTTIKDSNSEQRRLIYDEKNDMLYFGKPSDASTSSDAGASLKFTYSNFSTLFEKYDDSLFDLLVKVYDNETKRYSVDRIYSKNIIKLDEIKIRTLISADKITANSNDIKIEFDEQTEGLFTKKDRRVLVSEPRERPYSSVVRLESTFDGVPYQSSGVLVGPHHIITAAHNISRNDSGLSWASEIKVFFRNGNKSSVTKALVFDGWTSPTKCESFDIAMLTLKEPLGFQADWLDMLNTDDKVFRGNEVNITGYPGEGARQMWTMGGPIRGILGDSFIYNIDTSAGQSGSPVWLKEEGDFKVVGIHIGMKNDYNFGTRLSSPKVDILRKIILSKFFD